MDKGAKWYDQERPEVQFAGPIALLLYRQAQALQFVSFKDKDGRKEPGRTFTVWLKDLVRGPEATELLRNFCEWADRVRAESDSRN